MAKSSYLSNVLKSIKYATIDVVAEMNPVIVDTYRTNKDFVKDSIEELKQKAQESSSEKKNAIADTIKTTYANLKDDLKTGNFYNKGRIEEAENKAMEKAFGISLDFDMGGDDDSDFGFGDAFEEGGDDFGNFDSDDSDMGFDDDSSSSDPVMAKTMATAMGVTNANIAKSSRNNASAISGTLVETSKFNADVIALSTEKMMGGVAALGGSIHTDLTAINTNLASIVTFTDEAFRTHIENSSTFFETQKQQMQEQTDILKEILDLQKSVYKPERKSSDKVNISDILTAEGGLDLSAYKDYIKQNSGGIEGTSLGIFGMLAQFAPMMLAGFTGSPLSVPLKMLIKKTIPETLENAFDSLNKTIAGSISTALVNLTQAKKGHNGGFFQFLGDMFGLTVPKLEMDLSAYNKEAVSWNGKDHKALTDVIPTWLSKIYSGITGREEMRYDYEKGKFASVSDIRKDQQKEERMAVAKANYGINQELSKMMGKLQLNNEVDRQKLLDVIEKVEKQNFTQMKNFNPNSKKDQNPATFDIKKDEEPYFEIYKLMMSMMPPKTLLNGSRELLDSISDYNRTIRERENNGDSAFNALFNNSINETKIMDSPIMASAKRLDVTNNLLNDILSAITAEKITTKSTTKKTTTKKVPSKSKTKKTKNANESSPNTSKEEAEVPNTDIGVYEERLKKEDVPEAITEEQQLGYIEEIKSKETASEKIKSFFGGINRLMKKPMEFVTSAVGKIDKFAYTMFFGNGEEDVNSISKKLMKGFDDMFAKIHDKTTSVFNAIKDEFKKEGGTSFNGLFKAVFGVDLKAGMDDFKEAMFGDKNKSFFSGMGEVFGKGLKEITHDLFGNIRKSIVHFFKGDNDEFDKKEFTERMLGNASAIVEPLTKDRREEEENREAIKDLRENGISNILDTTGLDALKKQERRDKNRESAKKKNNPPKAAKGMKVTRTGLVAVSAGERIIPKYRNQASIDSRALHENTAISKFKHALGLGDVKIDSYAAGTDDSDSWYYNPNMTYEQFNKFYNTLTNDGEKAQYTAMFARDFANRTIQELKDNGIKTATEAKKIAGKIGKTIKNSNPALYDAFNRQITNAINSDFAKNVVKGAKEVGGFVGQVGQEAKNAGRALYDAFTEKDGVNDSLAALAAKFTPGEKEKNVLKDITNNWKKYLPKTLAGGALGAGFSTILGLMGGPILGAAVGAAVSLTTKSDAIQKWLFGDVVVNDEGKVVGRAGGIFSKELSTNIQNLFPDMAKGGIIGAISSVLPFVNYSPITGIILGSAVGYARKSQFFQDEFFGKDTNLGKAKDFVAKQLPKMGLGAAVAGLAGPFGLTTNLILGATMGLVSDTEEFKGMIFGTEDVNGKRHGGMVGFIRKTLELPLQGLQKILEETTETFKKEIIAPIKFAAKTVITQFQNMFLWVGDRIADSFAKHVWTPIGTLIADKIVVPIEKKLGKVINGVFGLAKKAITAPFRAIGALARPLRRRQLSVAGAARGTAQDRIIERQEIIEGYEERARNAKTQWGRNRLKKRTEKVREQFSNSESAKLDEFAGGKTAQELKDALLVNKSIGPAFSRKGKKKAIDDYIKGTFVETGLNKTLNSYVAQGLISNKERKAINKYVKAGDYKNAQKIVNRSLLVIGKNGKPEEGRELNEIIKKAALDIREAKKKSENAAAERDRIKQATGIDITGIGARRVLEKELHARGESSNITPGERADAKLNPTETFLSGIYTDVHTIADRLIKREKERQEKGESYNRSLLAERERRLTNGPIYDANDTVGGVDKDEYDNMIADFSFEELHRLQWLNSDVKKYEKMGIVRKGSTPEEAQKQIAEFRKSFGYINRFNAPGNTAGMSEAATTTAQAAEPMKGFGLIDSNTYSYEYTDEGMVKIRTNEQGELEPDMRDSETRDTIARRDEKDNTQKGILSKLTGIGTSIMDFFTGKDEKKEKKSIFAKILGAISAGFSWFGGSKLATALKWIGGGALGAFVLGRNTKRAKTDKNGNEIYDEDGNVQYMTIGDCIVDGIGYMLFGKAGKGGLIGFWTGTVFPWLKDFTVNTLIPGIQDGLHWIWDNIVLLLPKIGNWVLTTGIPGVLKGIEWASDKLVGIGETITTWVTDSLLPAVFEKLPTYINKAAGGLWNALLKALGLKSTEDPDEKKDTSTNKRYQNTEKPKEVKESDIIPNDTVEVNTGGTATLFGQELLSNNIDKLKNKGTTQYYGYGTNIDNNNGTVEKIGNNAYISNPYVSNTGTINTYDSGTVANYNQNTNTNGQPGTFVGLPENYYRSTNTTALGISDATQAVQGLTTGQKKDALYSSENYKNIENEAYKKRLWENDTVYEKWDTVYDTLDGQFTLGQILTTPGIRVMNDSYGKVITSDQIIKSPDGMNEVFGIDAVATNGEREANTTHYEHTPLQNTGKALAISVFNKGKLPNTMLRAAEKLTGAYFGVQGAVASKIPFIGRGLAAMNAIQAGVTTAPMKITEFANNFMKNRNAGKSVYESAAGSLRSTFKQKLTERIRGKKGLGDKAADALDKLHDSKAGKATSGVIEKIKKFLTEKLTDNKIITAIAGKINKGVGVVKGLEKVGNEKLKNLMLDITAKITEKLSSKTMQSAVASLGTNIAGYMGTAGVQLVATAVSSFIFGFKDADANFNVEEATLGERLISGIVNMISTTLLFEIFDTEDILSVVINALDNVIDMSDLKARQEKMQQIVDQYNDENETNYSVYDYLMKDKIETKINNFFHSRALDWATSTVQGVAEGVGGAVFNLGVGGVKGAFGLATAPLKSAYQAFNGEGNFFSNLAGNVGSSFKAVGSGFVGAAKSLGGGLATIGKGVYHTATGKTWDEAHDNGSHETADGGTAGGKGGSFGLTDEAIENAKAATDAALNPDTNTSAEEKTLDLVSSQYGLSTSDYLGETNEYKEQADKNREAVANLNSTWTVIGEKTNPFMTSILGVMDKAMSTVSKNIAVSLGLADAEDENVDLIKILNDDQYLKKRSEIIQQNSVLAGLFSGVTGSNSNNSATQESSAMKKYNSPNTANSTNKAVAKAVDSVSKGSSAKNPLKYSNWVASLAAAGKGSGVTPNKDVNQINPAEATFVSQKFGKYANQTFGVGTNKQRVSDAGCAPSTAVMALNSNIYHDTDIDMKEALKTASGYVSGNGGVTADYFADEFSKHGFKAAYVSKTDKNQKEIMKHQLNNGRSIILMGRDTRNTSKKKSPFGPNFHYVVATGMSADGKYVYINDPESNTPNMKYDVDTIFNNTDLTIVPMKAKNTNIALSPKVRAQLKKLSGKAASGIIFVGDSRTVGMENAIKASITKKFVAKSGTGYAWLNKTAYANVKKYANAYKDYAIVFNFGVNDLGNISSYINFYKKVVSTYGDRVYFMSVNPVNQNKYKGTATNKRIDEFNKKYKAFAGNRYIDTCTYMRTTGFESPDGLHYSNAQYQKIYDFTVDFINQVTAKSTAGRDTTSAIGAISNASNIVSSTATDDTSSTDTTTQQTSSRKHIRSISDLISAIGSILSGSYMLSSSDYNSLMSDSYDTGTDGTTTINTDGISGRVSSDPNVAKIQKELVAKMYSIKGKIDYSQSGPRNPDKGSADCSSTVQWAYKKITGKDIGDWTGAQETNSNTKFVDTPHNTRAFNENKLQLGDILLYGNNASDHVEMYAGNGQVIGHGSGKGPKVRSMGVVHPGKNWSAKRLANFNIAGKGSGLFVSQKSSQWANKKIGDERVSEAGCAPAVATMAIDNTKSYNMNTAIEDAAQYKSKGGGVSADYFVDTFKKQGYNCLVLTDKKKIIKALKQGNNAVLIGRDLTNKSKRRSPFGSNDHYVLATGISNDEKIIYINDPEATDPDITYKTDIVLNGVRVAIIPITLNNKETVRVNKSLSEAMSVFVGRASAVDAINSASSTVKSQSTNPVLTQCAKFQTQFMKDKKAGIKWHYRNPGKYVCEQWSQALAKNKRCCNCALLARWALKEAGLISKNTFFYGKQDGTIQWSSSSKADVEKKCDVIKIGNKTVNQLEASGDLKPGDVVTYKGMRHTNIYAGNKKWYDAGHAYCNGSGEGATFTSWYGNQKYGGYTVGYIIRKKDNVSGNVGSLSSSTSLDSSATGSTTDSGSTILDQLADAIALLAQGWGLASIDDSSSSGTYDTDSSGSLSSTTVTGKTAKAKIWNYLHAKGIPDNGIAGAMGNFQSESGNEFNRVQSDFTSDRLPSKAYTQKVNSGEVTKDQFIHGKPQINGITYGPGYGLAQWTSYGRKQGLYEAAKKNKASIDDPQTSLDYFWKELQDPYYKPTLNAMKAGTSVKAVSDTFLHNFEQPGDQSASVEQARFNNGNTILKEMTGKGSGLSTSGISNSANRSIASINRSNSENNNIRDIKFESITGKGSGLPTYSSNSTSSTSTPSVSFTQTRSRISVNDANSSSVNTAALLNAIINLLTQEVNNTASIQSIANAIVTLVDAKANDTSDVSTKKELLNTKQQIVSLMRRQNNDNASTSLGDLISSVEAIIAQ